MRKGNRPETEAGVKKAAKTAGVSQSRRIATRWPESVARLAEAWPDFPMAEEIRARLGEDVPREMP
jgi:hypothetical protein